MVNDVWGLRADPDLARLVAERAVHVVLMHNRSRPKDVVIDARLGGQYLGAHYGHLMEDVAAELRDLAEGALSHGIAREHIILDPGLGFGTPVTPNLALLKIGRHPTRDSGCQ